MVIHVKLVEGEMGYRTKGRDAYYMLQKVSGKAVFIHIPSIKNMPEGMMEEIVKCLEEIEIV